MLTALSVTRYEGASADQARVGVGVVGLRFSKVVMGFEDFIGCVFTRARDLPTRKCLKTKEWSERDPALDGSMADPKLSS
jgi:hypothetical protein